MKLIMCKGLPGSGKSTWAKQQVGYKRINKDDLRKMLDDGKWSQSNEKFILSIRDLLVRNTLDAQFNVIADDTNLAPKHEATLRSLAKSYGAQFEVKDFTNVPIETCIERDLKRFDSVGEAVIRKQYNQFLRPKITAPIWDNGKPTAIVCDLDGTLALFGDANPYDRDFEADAVNEPVRSILRSADDRYEILLVSGRKAKYMEATERWLDFHEVNYDGLFMRATDDNRKDSIVKEEIYRTHIEPHYNVLFVLDDRNQVVELWRSLGLTCLQVAEGDF